MRNIIYYVAMSLDGYITGPNESYNGYVGEGSGLEQYLHDLKLFDTVIMGKNTYEFGFKFGNKPGMPAYEHMDHYIFSNTASYPNKHEQVKIVKRDISVINELKNGQGTDIYLCGGGIFAGWVLENKLIDILKIKLSPVILGDGIPLFVNTNSRVNLELIDHVVHDYGLIFLTYRINY